VLQKTYIFCHKD